MHRRKNTSLSIKFFGLCFTLLAVLLFLLGYSANISHADSLSYESTHITTHSQDLTEFGDSEYATKEYWDSIIGPHEDKYVDSIEPGAVFGNVSDTEPQIFVINHDITVNKSSTPGTSGIVIRGSVIFIFELDAEGNYPTLTVNGADGSGKTPAGCGIEVGTVYVGPIIVVPTFTVKGKGKIIAKSGDVFDDLEVRRGKNGTDGSFDTILPDAYGGSGGAGGDGIGAGSAAIGSKGSAGAAGGGAVKGASGGTYDAKDGPNGNNGHSSVNSANSGNIIITGNMSLELSFWHFGWPDKAPKASAGNHKTRWHIDHRGTAGAGGGGGSGGVGGSACDIGTGGVGGAGGGSGGGGGVDYDEDWPWSVETYALNGGGGGAGFGIRCMNTVGGLANTYVCDDDISPATEGKQSYHNIGGDPGVGTNMNGYDGDNHKGGTGGKGGSWGEAGVTIPVKSTTLETRGSSRVDSYGEYAAIERYYPHDECKFECVGGVIDEDTGLHVYAYEEGFIPSIKNMHFPTGTEIGYVDKDQYDIQRFTEESQELYTKIRLELTPKDAEVENPYYLWYYMVTGATITVGESTLKVSKNFDGNSDLESKDISGELKITLPNPIYEGKVFVVPEYDNFSQANVHSETKTINLHIEYKEEVEVPCYLSKSSIEVPYEIIKSDIEVDKVEFKNREYDPEDPSVVISSVNFIAASEHFNSGEEIPLVVNKDYVINESKISDEDITCGQHNVSYKLDLTDQGKKNVSFKDDEESYEGTSLITVEPRRVGLVSAEIKSREFEPDNFFVDILSAEFVYLPGDVELQYNTDYKVYWEDKDGQGKIAGDNCFPGEHTVAYQVELLNENFKFLGGSQKSAGLSTTYINKVTVQVDDSKTLVNDVVYDPSNYDVEISQVSFHNILDAYPLELNKDYDIFYSKIWGADNNVGKHQALYVVRLFDNGIYQFEDGLDSDVGLCDVYVVPREVAPVSAECKPRDFEDGNYDVDINSVHFSNMPYGVALNKDIDYKILSAQISDDNCNPGIHNVNYQVALLNSNYEFENSQEIVQGTAKVQINELENSKIAATGDNPIYPLLCIFLLLLVVASSRMINVKQ